MLGTTDVIAMVAVKDLETARQFYEGTLGLAPFAVEDGLITFQSGKALFNVYQSGYAGTNQATALSWSVGDRLEDVVAALRAKGVTFEHYDMPDASRDGDIHTFGGIKAAWFKDPDGNILNVSNP
jgi:catechol 2,3-dioxygenase-like lactoylglutathione lyase family enzyme